MSNKSKKKGSSILTRSVRRNQLRQKYGNKALKGLWKKEQMLKSIKAQRATHPELSKAQTARLGKNAYMHDRKACDPRGRQNTFNIV